MATWKKVAVSGSDISQFNNDAGYLTSVTAQPTFVSASYDGTALIADDANGNLTFASSSGAGLTISANAGTDTLTFGLSAIPNASLENSAITIAGQSTSLGGSITAATIGNAIGAFSGSSQVDHDATTNFVANEHIDHSSVSISAGDGLSGGGDITTTRTLSIDTGSAHFTAGVSKEVFDAANFADSSEIDFTVTAGTSVTAALINGSIANARLANSSITIAGNATSLGGSVTLAQITNGSGIVSGSSLSSAAQGEVVLTTNGVAASAVDLGLQTTDSPQFVNLTLTGDAAVNGGDITTTAATFNLVNSNATTVNFAGAATTLNVGNASGTTTIAGDAVVQGDFTVNGTTTYLNVQDLYVEDKFILLASGSATAGDGGIIIDRGSDAAGNIAYGYDSVTDRWGFQNGVTDSTNTIDPTSASGVSGSFVPYLFTENDHGATKPTTGEFAVQGAMYTSNAGDIWIYA